MMPLDSFGHRAWSALLSMALLALLAGCSAQTIESIEYGADTNAPNNDFNNDAPNNDGANNLPNNDANNEANNDVANNDVNNAPNNDALDCTSDADCAAEDVCVEGHCQGIDALCGGHGPCDRGAPEDYDFGLPSSVMTGLSLETDPNTGADLNGDGLPDNALGGLLTDLGALLGDSDLNSQLQEAIDGGELSLGATWPSMGEGEQPVEMHMFILADADEDPLTRDRWLARRESFYPETMTPRVRFSGGTLSDGVMTAGPSMFTLMLPLGELMLTLSIDNAYIAGDLGTDELGVMLGDGSLAGAVRLSNIIDALNAFLASDACACLGLDGPLIDLSRGMDGQACVGTFDDAACGQDGPEALCGVIAGACPLAIPVIAGQTDMDLDGDGAPDAISVFLRLELAGAIIEGIAQP